MADKDFSSAASVYRRLMLETHVSDLEYDDWLRGLADAQQALNKPLDAGYVYLYLHYFDRAGDCFLRAKSPLDLALCHESQKRHQQAADIYRKEGRLAHAAASYECVKQFDTALQCWEELATALDPRQQRYLALLCKLNIINCLKLLGGDERRAKRELVEALVLLEQEAEERENTSRIDDALDCYQLMIQIGLEQASFENLCEGYVNAIRILREQGRFLTALRYYAGIGEAGRKVGEHHAVATLYREAAEAANRAGLLYTTHYVKLASEAWFDVSRRNAELGLAAELSENALLAALDGYNQLDDSAAVLRCYEALAALPIAPDRQRRYLSLAETARKERRDPLGIYPPSEILRRGPRFQAIWRDDLLEWEVGDAYDALFSRAIWDLGYHDTVRRRALNLVLHVLDDREKRARSAEIEAELAHSFAYMRPKVAHRGLLRLLQSPHQEVRNAVMRAAGSMRHVLGLDLLAAGLADKDSGVSSVALSTLAEQNFPEAFDTFRRIDSAEQDLAKRRVLVQSIGKLKVFEAAEYLYRLLVSGEPAELMPVLRESLQGMLKPEWREILLARKRNESSSAQQRLAFLGN